METALMTTTATATTMTAINGHNGSRHTRNAIRAFSPFREMKNARSNKRYTDNAMSTKRKLNTKWTNNRANERTNERIFIYVCKHAIE